MSREYWRRLGWRLVGTVLGIVAFLYLAGPLYDVAHRLAAWLGFGTVN